MGRYQGSGDVAVAGLWKGAAVSTNYRDGNLILTSADFMKRYTNINYPFPVDPGSVSYVVNETGCYSRRFDVPAAFKDHQLRLRFESVDSAFHVWVNGKEVGYTQGSRNPSELDITKLVDTNGENTLAAQVYQFCDGSYIEDQVSAVTPY
jgi:beta-galactosidase/beta-glucuronidase